MRPIAFSRSALLAFSLASTGVAMAQSLEVSAGRISGLETAAAPSGVESHSLTPGETVVPVPASESEKPKVHRDPFWPVGYVPPPEKTATRVASVPGTTVVRVPETEVARQPEWDQARRRLNLRGLSSTGRDRISGKPRFVAVMAGRIAEEGDTVSAAFEGQIYRWKVVAIGSNGVSLVKVDVRPE